MSEEITSQDTTQDVAETSQESPNIGLPPKEIEAKGASPEEKDATEVFYGEEKKEDAKESKEEESKEEPSEEETSEDKEDEKVGQDYKLELPKDTRLRDADMERIASYAKEQGLSKDAAQKLLQGESEARDSYFEKLQEDHQENIREWQSEVKLDKELGGENYNKNIELARRVAHKFGSERFLKDLDESGYGNHPEMVRVFARIGKSMHSDEFVRAGSQSGGDRSMEDLFYGKQN